MVQVPGDDSELKNVQKEISVIETTLTKYDLIELALSEDARSLRLYDVLKAKQDELTQLRKKENILLQSQQQQQGDLT
jgi:hypothetical protein